MDKDRQDSPTTRQGLFGRGYGSPTNPGVTSHYGSLSPYLNIDPSFIIEGGTESQYIFPEGASQRRGRLELAFSQIGGSVLGGAIFGGVNGFVSGMRAVEASQLTTTARRTQMLNSVTKRGASTAQTLGIIALMYSVIGVLFSKLRGAEDELNTVAAATSTGLLYKSTAGYKKCLRAGGFGFGLASVYCLYTSKDRLKQMFGLEH